MKKRIKVDFIGIGAPKCGTTWIFHCLGQHHKVCLSVPKEIKYFNVIDFTKHKPAYHDNNVRNKNNEKPISWYERCFNHCPQDSIKGEFTPTYLYDEKAPLLIKKLFPDAKLIACLRNPLERAYSSYWSRKIYTKTEHLKFEEAIKEDPTYIEGGLYHKHLMRYLEYFGRDQLLILLFDDIVSSPEREIIKVLRFLDLESASGMYIGKVSRNQSKKSWFPYAKFIMTALPSYLIDLNLGVLLHLARRIGFRSLFFRLTTSSFKYPEMDLNTREHLRRVFEGDIRNLEKLLDRDLSHWI